MFRYIVQRLIALVVIMFFVSFFSFMLIHLLPGDPVLTILGPGAAIPGAREALTHQLGLDKPLLVQYFNWLGHILHGHLGESYVQDPTNPVPVWPTIKAALIIDFQLVLFSQILALGTAVPLALRAARRPNGLFDRAASGTTFVLLSIPIFVTIIFLVWFFADYLGIPHIGPGYYVAGGPLGWNIVALSLAAIALAIGSFVVYFRVFRTDLIATYQEEFITMARSKGLSRRRITWRHAVRPSVVPLLSTIGINVPSIIAGSFIVEVTLQIYGLGWQLVSAVGAGDYIMLQAIIFTVATITVLVNFIIDIAFGFIDPRISRD